MNTSNFITFRRFGSGWNDQKRDHRDVDGSLNPFVSGARVKQFELDIDLPRGRGRRERDYATMVRWTDNIAEISRRFIGQTELKMNSATA